MKVSGSDFRKMLFWTVYFHVSSDNLKHLYSYIQVVMLVENHKGLLPVDLAVL